MLGDSLGDVSVSTIYRWIQEEKIPSRKVVKLRKALALNKQELDSLFPKVEKYTLAFRKKKGHEGLPQYQERFKELSEAIFFVTKPGKEVSPFKSAGILSGQTSPEQAQNAIRDCFKISGVTSFDELVKKLQEHEIFDAFYPFELFAKNEAERKELAEVVAFTAFHQQEKRYIIIHNSNRTLHDASYDLIHELAHIFLGENTFSKEEEEDFCNDVATAFFAPKPFFDEKKKEILKALNSSREESISSVIALADELNISFQSVLIRVQDLGYIKDKTPQSGRLWSYYHSNIKPFEKAVGKVTDVNVEFWRDNVFKGEKTKFNEIFRKFHTSFYENKLSHRFTSWLFKIPDSELPKLIQE